MKISIGIAFVAVLVQSPFLSGFSHASTIITVAGNGEDGLATAASLYFPATVMLDSNENVVIADYFNHRIRRVDAKTGIITTIAGNGEAKYGGDAGKATDASFKNPIRFTFDSKGNLF